MSWNVKNRWNDSEASKLGSTLDEIVYASRLLGADPSLVLHGGGNTSAKGKVCNLLGEAQDVLFIKGSGWDLATIEGPGFPATDLTHLRKLRRLERLSDEDMVNELRTHLLDASSPTPSVEALLHAFIPHPFILHTHADAIVALNNQPGSAQRLADLYGNRVAFVPYIMPGFALAKKAAEVYEANPDVEGLILLQHGIFSFGETAKQAYDRMIDLVSVAAREIDAAANVSIAPVVGAASRDLSAARLNLIRQAYARRGFNAVLQLENEEETLTLLANEKLRDALVRGPLTPDHVIRTKRLPLLLSENISSVNDAEFEMQLSIALDNYAADYENYFRQHSQLRNGLTILDPLPRVILVPGMGVVSVGKSCKAASIVADIYDHTLQAIAAAEAMHGYKALPANDIFDVEYWSLEQAKLGKGKDSPPLQGKTAMVTGAAGGIGKAIAAELLRCGASVALLDRNEEALRDTLETLLPERANGNSLRGFPVDVTSPDAVTQAFRETVLWTGGIDIVVQNAGLFPACQLVTDIDDDEWHRSLSVNLDGALHIARQGLKWLERNVNGGDIVIVATKNVPAPGKKAASYSVAKAAQAQLARICALEAGEYGIRVNMLHPHMVFDTGLWTEELLRQRADAYGMSVDQYKRNNLLHTELCSADVARAARAFVDGTFSKTTGAQIAIDGGSDRTL
ncbi:MAG: bifunctional aldolase/short-chain dehydrogenase [Chrysiogenetes bacterium]|nr:bifunctional aldolase/short-chain dehydrogenase [Chrysiogenetes bacterium]